ncbi:unnamed protein product [Cladocopium goreaui]|uniref:Vacuolar membrane protein n=1 Tax=Cladocopium goreaui TaxID=2562237 RepID=A0A9P1DPV9_9DINO|nr:unnamed protein product [Cladocopium goreaui]
MVLFGLTVGTTMGCCWARIRSFDDTPRLRHVLLVSFRPETTINQEIEMMKTLSSLPQIFPQVLRSYVYPDLRLAGGQSHPAGKNRGLVWMADFRSRADFEAFEHDEQQMKMMIAFESLMEPGSRATLQYADPLPMIEGAHHIVMFSVKDDVTAEEFSTLESSLRNLKQQIEEIHSINVAAAVSNLDGQTLPGNRNIAALVDFASIEKYEVYEKHPAHLSVVEKNIKPLISPGSRAAIQFAS